VYAVPHAVSTWNTVGGQRRYLLATVREHLIQNGRHADFRV
jgi:hypothetical protein